MSASRLKFYLVAIWGTIAVLGGGLVLWTLTSPEAQSVIGIAAREPETITPTPSLSPSPVPSPTQVPTRQIIRATRRPGTEIPAFVTNTPGTPLPIGPLNAGYPPGYDPLTGLKVEDESRLERRPIAVKISTFPRSLRKYQSGLSQADVAYEYYIEDGLTRFIAVFYGEDAERAGPVRSGRYFDEHIARMYHSSLVFANADERVEKYLLESDLKPLLFLPRGDNCPPLCHDSTIEGYNDVFVDTAGVGAFLSDNSQQTLRPTYFYGAIHSLSLQKMNRIVTHYSAYSYNYWEYDTSQLKYLRYSDTNDLVSGKGENYAPHIDRLTGQQISTDNVVVLVVPHNFKNDFDRADQVFDIQLTGSGPAYVFSNGLFYTGVWKRDLVDQPIQLFDANNVPIRLKPGQTFYQVVNSESTIRQAETSMDFTFFIPPRSFTPTPTATKFKPTRTPNKHE